jgi:hypothetical protein
MADEQFVPADAFITTTKILLSLIHELTIEMQVQRVAILRATSLPVQPDFLKEIAAGIREVPELQRVREAILSMTTIAEVNEVLKRLEELH